MEYDAPARGIGSAGTCQDCGYRQEGIKWSRTPEVKDPKCNSCFHGHDGTPGVYQPCGCNSATKDFNPPPPPPSRIIETTLLHGERETEESKKALSDYKVFMKGYAFATERK